LEVRPRWRVAARGTKSLTPEGVSYMKGKGANREIGVPRRGKNADDDADWRITYLL
jgi:hypothetical protein